MIGFWLGLSKVVGTAVTRIAGKTAFLCIKHAPELLMGGRIILTVGGTVSACKAAVSAQEVLNKYEADEKKIREAAAKIREKQDLYTKLQKEDPKKLEECKQLTDENGYPMVIAPNEYTPRDYKLEMLKLKATFAKDMGKKFALSIGMFSLALVFDILGYRTVSNRIASLAMTCSGLQQIVKAQQAKIEQLTGINQPNNAVPVEATVTDENGNETPAHAETIELEDLTAPVELFFGEGNPNWSRDRTYNLRWLEGVQTDLNNLLATRTFVTLNDVGYALDKDRFVPRRSWYVWGWANTGMTYDEIKAGMSYRIRLGIDDPINEGKTEFILRPNIDGFIYADIPEDEGLHEADQLKGFFSNLNGKFDLHKLMRR